MYKFAKKVANHEGFTLVELIVVIAILGILAGIAIPVYSGYIKKANQAKDNVLLGAVNVAFAAAWIENHPNEDMPDHATLATTGSAPHIKVTGITTPSLDASASPINPIDESFKKYFAGNSDSEFVFYDNFGYDKAEGFFGKVGTTEYRNNSVGSTITSSHDDAAGTTTYTVTRPDGTTTEYTVNDADAVNVRASTFGTNMTADGLVNSVGGVVDAAAGVVNNPNLIESIVNNIMGSGYTESLGISSADPDYAEKVTNALVVAVAKDAAGMVDTEEKMNNMLDQLTDPSMIDYMAGMTQQQLVQMASSSSGMANLAMLYGMMTAYANSETGKTVTVDVDGTNVALKDYFTSASAGFANATGGSDALKKLVTMTQVMANTSGFSDYMETSAVADFKGLASAFNVISGNGNTMLTDGGVLKNGFTNNSEIAALLAQFFGG